MNHAEAYAGRTVLITGAGGFVGSSLAAALAGVKCRVRRLSRRTLAPVGGIAAIEDRTTPGAEPERWRDVLSGVDVVFHCAAQTSVYAAAADPIGDLHANADMTLRLLVAARDLGTRPTVLHASTIAVFGPDPGVSCVDERVADDPSTFYDVSKLAAERYLRLFAESGAVAGASLRFGNLYGPGSAPSAPDRGVLNLMIRRALAGEDITVYGGGRWTRDYVYIDDAVTAFLAAGLRPDALKGRAYVVCSGEGVQLRDAFALAAARVAARSGRSVALRDAPPPSGMSTIDFRSYYGNSAAFSTAVGWRPETKLAAGIDRTIDFLSAAAA